MNRKLIGLSFAAAGLLSIAHMPTAHALACSDFVTVAGGNWVDGTTNNPPAATAPTYPCTPGPLGDSVDSATDVTTIMGGGPWSFIYKENTPGGGEDGLLGESAVLDITPNGGAPFGTWAITGNANFWNDWDRAVIVLKDGWLGAIDNDVNNNNIPDDATGRNADPLCQGNDCKVSWFAYEITRGHLSGDWGWVTSVDLSHASLYGVRCTQPNGCRPPDEVPEPGTLALLGLGLLGLGLGRRKRSAT